MSEIEVQKAAADSGLLMWIAGAAVAAWNGLLTLFLVGLRSDNRDLRAEMKAVSTDREAHCVPRPECVRTHETLNTRFDRFEDEVKGGIKGIHERLDIILNCKGKQG